LTISPSLTYSVSPGNTPTAFTAQIIPSSSGAYSVTVQSRGNGAQGNFQAGGNPSSQNQSNAAQLNVADQPSVSGNFGVWYLGTAVVNDNCVAGSTDPSQSCYYNTTQLTVSPGNGGTAPSAGSPATWSLTDAVTGQPPSYLSKTCADSGCSQVALTATSYPPACGKVNLQVSLNGILSAVYPFYVDYPASASATFWEDIPYNPNPGYAGYASNNSLLLKSACGNRMFGIDVHEEFPASFRACGMSVNWTGGNKLGSWRTLTDGVNVGAFGPDQVGFSAPPGSATPNPQCPGMPATGQCVADPVPPSQLSSQANAYAAQFIFVGSQDVQTLGKFFPAAPNMQVRYTDHGRDELGTWQCPVQ
jgi:hypothetical protein